MDETGRLGASRAGAVPTVLLDALLAEAVRLAEDVRDWLVRGRGDAAAAPPGHLAALVEARETGRVTARVGHVVAWLLHRKALAAGEIDTAEALAPERRLGDRQTCLEEPGEGDQLPPRLAELLARSAALYARIDRLDRALDAA